MSNLTDLLLRPEVPNVQKKLPQAQYRVKRLSELTGEDVIFTLQALPYGRVQEMKDSLSEDMQVHTALAGLKEPDMKDQNLAAKFGGITPAETLKAMLLPGEIDEIAREVERLTGYRKTMLEEVKKPLPKEATAT